MALLKIVHCRTSPLLPNFHFFMKTKTRILKTASRTKFYRPSLLSNLNFVFIHLFLTLRHVCLLHGLSKSSVFQTTTVYTRSVIREEQIEPVVEILTHSSSKLHHGSKRTASHLFQTSQNDEYPTSTANLEARAPTPATPRMRKDTGFLKRRKLWEVENPVVSELECQNESADGGVSVNYEDAMHSILPSELRWGILKRLGQSELLQLRVISRKWRNTIDSIIKVNVKIQGDSKEFRGKCDLPIKCCQLVSLQNPSHRQLFKAGLPEEVRIVRGICSLNFEELVLQWTNLTKLELCWRSTMKNLLFEKKGLERFLVAGEILPNLMDLKLEMLTNDNLGKRTQQRILSNMTNLSSYNYPNLKDLSIVFVGYRELHAENRYLSILLPFLSRHANSLCCINFTLKYTSHVIYPPAHPRHILFCVPANIKSNYTASQSSSEGHLVSTQLRKLDETPAHNLEWIDMLKNKRRLEVAIMTRFLSWSIKHLDFFKPVINGYSKFLRRVDIMNVTMYDSGAHNTVTQLDARIFQECVQLAQLRVYRAPIIFHEDEIEPASELFNLQYLPKSLEDLVIDGLPVSSLEILATVTEFMNLRSFHYFQSQVPRRNMLWTNGINWEILQCVIRHPKLVNVKVHVTMVGQAPSYIQYEESLSRLANEHGWSTTGIVPGYMNMFQITLTKPNVK